MASGISKRQDGARTTALAAAHQVQREARQTAAAALATAMALHHARGAASAMPRRRTERAAVVGAGVAAADPAPNRVGRAALGRALAAPVGIVVLVLAAELPSGRKAAGG